MRHYMSIWSVDLTAANSDTINLRRVDTDSIRWLMMSVGALVKIYSYL